MATETFTSGALTLELSEGDAITVTWRGKSSARNPGEFILPILAKALDRGESTGKAIQLDFRELDYMNSSTITPVIRVLKQAKLGSTRVSVLYRRDLKWQALSFTALEVFHTEDQRIEIRGA